MNGIGIMPKKKFAAIKDKDEKRWAIEGAANTLKEFAAIKKQPKLMKAARDYLKMEIADSKKAIKL